MLPYYGELCSSRKKKKTVKTQCGENTAVQKVVNLISIYIYIYYGMCIYFLDFTNLPMNNIWGKCFG